MQVSIEASTTKGNKIFISVSSQRFHMNTYYAPRLRASDDKFKVLGPSLC